MRVGRSKKVLAIWADDGSPAFAVRTSVAGMDVFVGVPQRTPELIHAIAKLSGVHCFSEPGPALWTTDHVHAGRRIVKTEPLPSLALHADRALCMSAMYLMVAITELLC